jgi:hypothetical protein
MSTAAVANRRTLSASEMCDTIEQVLPIEKLTPTKSVERKLISLNRPTFPTVQLKSDKRYKLFPISVDKLIRTA